jgi:HAD superfamily hydrolase (TIGR01509 family)
VNIDTVEAVIFDMDGTLVHTEPIHRLAWLSVIESDGHVVTPDEYAQWFTGVTNRDICRGLLGLADDAIEATIAAVDKRFWEIAQDGGISPLIGVHELLAATAHMPRAVGTNAEREPALRTLATAGLLDHFSTIVTLNDVRLGKPAPDIYLEAARQLGVDPANCIVFEDSRPGLAAAVAAGMRCIAITSNQVGYDDAHLIVAGLDDPRIGPLFAPSGR